MKEYKLKINGEIDFIIISPQVFSSLISQIHSSPECEVAVNIEDIMPPGFTDYLLRVINVNRFTNERFRYRYILENPITKKGLYEILLAVYNIKKIQSISSTLWVRCGKIAPKEVAYGSERATEYDRNGMGADERNDRASG